MHNQMHLTFKNDLFLNMKEKNIEKITHKFGVIK